MKLYLLFTILVVLALVVAAALTFRAVIAGQSVIYRGEALQNAADPCAGELTGQGQAQAQPAVESEGQNPATGIDRCQQDITLRAPHGVEYAYMVLRKQLFKARRGGCDGYPLPELTD